jgi:DNA uptake protein ComE-like DNA-binding protein
MADPIEEWRKRTRAAGLNPDKIYKQVTAARAPVAAPAVASGQPLTRTGAAPEDSKVDRSTREGVDKSREEINNRLLRIASSDASDADKRKEYEKAGVTERYANAVVRLVQAKQPPVGGGQDDPIQGLLQRAKGSKNPQIQLAAKNLAALSTSNTNADMSAAAAELQAAEAEMQQLRAQQKPDDPWYIDVLKFVDKPRAAIVGGFSQLGKAIDGDPETVASWDDWREFYNNNTPTSALIADDMMPGFLRAALGFTVDVLLDPVTWLTAGGLGVAKAAGKAGIKTATNVSRAADAATAAGRVDDAAEYARVINNLGRYGGISGLTQADKQVATRALREVGQIGKNSDLLGGAYIRLPTKEGILIPGSRAVLTPTMRAITRGTANVRATKGFAKVAHPFSTEKRDFLMLFRNGTPMDRINALKSLNAQNMSKMNRASFVASANLQLTDLLRRTDELGIQGDQLLRQIDAPGSRGTEAIQAQMVTNPQVKSLVDEWSQWWEFTRQEANRLAGRDDFLMKRKNYTFHTLLQMFDDDLEQVSRQIRQGGRFTELPMQMKAEIVEGGKYRGETLWPVDDAINNPQRLSPEDQAIQILKKQGKLDDNTEALFNKDLRFVTSTYVHMVGQRLAGETMLREMVSSGVGMTAKQYKKLAKPYVTEHEKLMMNLRLNNVPKNAQTFADLTGVPLVASFEFNTLRKLADDVVGIGADGVDAAALRASARDATSRIQAKLGRVKELREEYLRLTDDMADSEWWLQQRAAGAVNGAELDAVHQVFDASLVRVWDEVGEKKLLLAQVERELSALLRSVDVDGAYLRQVDDAIERFDSYLPQSLDRASNLDDVVSSRKQFYYDDAKQFVSDTDAIAARRANLAQQMDAVDELRDAATTARDLLDELNDARTIKTNEQYLRSEYLRIVNGKGSAKQKAKRLERIIGARGGTGTPLSRELMEQIVNVEDARTFLQRRVEALRVAAEDAGRLAGNLGWQNVTDDAALKASLANRKALKTLLKEGGSEGEIAARQQVDRLFRLADGEADDNVKQVLRLQAQADLGEVDNPGQWDAFFTGKLAEDEQLAKRVHLMVTQGLTQFNPDTYLPAQISRILDDGAKMMAPSDVKGLLRVFDYLTNVFKSYAVMSPGFVTRNVVGAVMNNWLGGVNIRSYNMFLRADRAYKGAIKAGKTPEQALEAISKSMSPQASEAFGSWLKIAPLVAGGQASSFAADVGTDAAALGARRGARSPYQIARKGDRAGFINGSQTLTDNTATRNFFYFNTSAEYNVRGVMAFDEFMFKAGNLDSAIDRVYTYHFDYEDLSSLERNVLKRVIPFYVWTSRNLPLQIKGLFTKPKVAASYLKLKQNVEELSEDEQTVPSFYRRLLGIQLPWQSDQGNSMYFMPDLPFRDLGILRTPDRFTLNPLDMAGQFVDLRELGSGVNPVIKAPLETQLMERNTFTGAPLTGEMKPVPPLLRPLGEALKLLGQAQTGADGQLMVSDKALHLAEGYWPVLGRLRRALPDSEDQAGQEKQGSFFLSFFLGLGFRTNTFREQSNELYRQMEDLDKAIGRMEDLGYTVPTASEAKSGIREKVQIDYEGEFRPEASFVLQAANTLTARELADLPGFGESAARWVELQRLAYGGFETLDDLVAVEGMSWSKLNEALLKMRDDPESWGQARAVPIDINTSDVEDLVALPGVGETTARKILAYRQRYGGFSSLADLRRVGISKTNIELIRDYLIEDDRKRREGVAVVRA